MVGLLGTCLYFLIASFLVIFFIKPIYTFFFPQIKLLKTEKLIGLVFFVLMVSPLSTIFIFTFSLIPIAAIAVATQYLFPDLYGALAADSRQYLVVWLALIYFGSLLFGIKNTLTGGVSR